MFSAFKKAYGTTCSLLSFFEDMLCSVEVRPHLLFLRVAFITGAPSSPKVCPTLLLVA